MHTTLLVLHILFAGLWIGASGTIAFLSPYLEKRGTAHWLTLMTGFEGMGKRFFPVAGIGVLLTGILLVLDGDFYGFGDAFVVIGIGVVVIGIILGNVVFDPMAKRAIAAGPDMDEAIRRSLSQRLMAFGALDFALSCLPSV